ncbi:hypothetical protein EJB05_48525, partial [Eragrostis curvula]
MATASSHVNSEAAAKVGEGALRNLPTDAFVEILLRLLLRSLWRCRFVSQYWRAVIDERTPRSQPKALVFCMANDYQSSSTYVIDNLALADGRFREIWRRRCPAMIGTCNGLLCLFDSSRNVTLMNPVTDETLVIPRHPRQSTLTWKTYSFGFHLPTGLYKIVRLRYACRFYVLEVYTLGDASWHDVRVPGGSTYRIDADVISVDGSTFWLTHDAGQVASFDLGHESITNVPLPVKVGPDCYYNRCHLTEVHGRLGLAVSTDQNPALVKLEVWVLGEGRERHKWSRKYRVQMEGVEQQLARPHFAHGEYVLTTDTRTWEQHMHGEPAEVFGHRLLDKGTPLVSGEVFVRIRDPGTAVAGITTNSCLRGTFAYVETTEPLGCYRLDS